MTSIDVGVRLAASPAEVWDDIRDISTHVEWMHDAEAINFTSDQREGAGTTFDCLTRVGPIRLSDRMAVTSWVEGAEIGVRHDGVVAGEGRFSLSPSGDGGTDFRWTETLRFPWWLGGPLGGAVGRFVLAAIWRRNLRNLADRFA